MSSDLQQALQPYPELWFEDGNVVLIAEDRSFRVHKSVLSRTSDFFRDMFSLPQPPLSEDDGGGEESTLESHWQCPVIPTSETAEDLTYFLDAVYNSLKYFQKNSQITFNALRAILMLSQKFSSDELRIFAVGRLEAAFPRKFAEWEAISEGERLQPVVHSPDELISIANLTRELGLRAILPVVLYDCCQLEIDSILEGVTRDAPDETGSSIKVLLNKENQKSCLLARSKLTAATLSMLATLAYARDGMCDQFTCNAALREVSLGGLVKDKALHNPLVVLDEEFASAPAPQPQGIGVLNMVGGPPLTGIAVLCRYCRDSCRDQMRIAREKLLRDIDEYIPVDV